MLQTLAPDHTRRNGAAGHAASQAQSEAGLPAEGAWDTIRPSSTLFASRQIHASRMYALLRALVPLPAMLIVWAAYASQFGAHPIPRLIDTSVTMKHLVLSAAMFAIWNLCFSWKPQLSERPWMHMVQELRGIGLASLAASTVLLPRFTGGHQHILHFGAFALLAGVLAVTASVLLTVAWLLYGHVAPRMAAPRRCLIAGSGPRAQVLRDNLLQAPETYELVGCIDDEYHGVDLVKDRYIGRIADLEGLLRTHPIDTVLIGLPVKSCYNEIQQVIQVAENVGVETHYPADVFTTSVASRHHNRQHHALTTLRVTQMDDRQYVKRLLDIVGSLLLLLCSAPIVLAACIAILMTDPGPLFFVQERYGKHRQRFRMYKLRTMVVNAEALQAELEHKNEAKGPNFKIKRDPRVTRVGAFLRKTSIDELPQLLNVLRGEMSLVGPRPLPVRDVQRFEEAWLLRRFSVRPGLTCLWQVSGRSNTTFDFWIRQDLIYIDNWSLGLDMKILVKTVKTVVLGSGAM